MEQQPRPSQPADRGAGFGAPGHCRNCGSVAAAAYCPACGQETQLRLPTFMQFMKDAAGRYVALDGKWWKTFAALVLRPGFLTREYLAGRRRRYVRPSRLFLVAILLLFAVLRLETGFGRFDMVKFDVEPPGSPQAQAVTPADKARAAVEVDDAFQLELGRAESALPLVGERLARFRRLSGAEKATQLTDGALRYGPYAMFVLLPAFAAMLKIVYLGSARRRPQRPRLYGEHLIFAAHNTAFLAFWASAAFVLPEQAKAAAVLWPLAYLLWSMRVVYGGRWAGTLARAGVLFVSYSALFGLAIAGLVMAAVVLH